MASRSDDERIGDPSVIEKRQTKSVEKEEIQPEQVKVVLLKSVQLKYTGPVTGTLYVFSGAGSVRDDVDIRDWEIMKNKKRNTKCCPGSIGGNENYFELVP